MRVSRVVFAVVGALLVVAALAAVGASALGVGPLGGGSAAGLLLGSCLLAGAAYPLYLARILRIPWHLAESGRSAEAIVLRVGRGAVVQGFRTYWTIHRVTLAVQVSGGTPYEAVATVLGWANAGERLPVFVDPANPKDVLVPRD